MLKRRNQNEYEHSMYNLISLIYFKLSNLNKCSNRNARTVHNFQYNNNLQLLGNGNYLRKKLIQIITNKPYSVPEQTCSQFVILFLKSCVSTSTVFTIFFVPPSSSRVWSPGDMFHCLKSFSFLHFNLAHHRQIFLSENY